MTTVTQTLRTEHEEILKMLTVAEALAHRLDKEERVPQKTLEKVVEFFGVFVGKCHDGKENDILFPALISKGLPWKDSLVGSLLRQHKQGWPLFRALADATYNVQFHFDGSGQRWAHAAGSIANSCAITSRKKTTRFCRRRKGFLGRTIRPT